MNSQSTHVAYVSNPKKKALLIALGVVCLAVTPFMFYEAFVGPNPAAYDAELRRSHGSRGDAAILPFGFLIGGAVSLLVAKATSYRLELDGNVLKLIYGNSNSPRMRSVVDLSQISAARAIGEYDTRKSDEIKTEIELKDRVGNSMDLDLSKFKTGDTLWLRQPLEAALRSVGADGDADIQRVLAGWQADGKL